MMPFSSALFKEAEIPVTSFWKILSAYNPDYQPCQRGEALKDFHSQPDTHELQTDCSVR